jgi:hypothetical protein
MCLLRSIREVCLLGDCIRGVSVWRGCVGVSAGGGVLGVSAGRWCVGCVCWEVVCWACVRKGACTRIKGLCGV